ncbi:MAG: HAD family hydrolase [Dehalococcoidia bacterium]
MSATEAWSPRLLIFDLDGTLIDSQDGIARSFNVGLRTCGADPVPHTTVYAMIGLPLTHMFGEVLPASLQHLVPDCITAYREHYGAVEIPRSTAFPGVTETLAACRAAGRTLTVATTKGQLVAEQAIAAAGLRPYFDFILGGDQVPNHKPAPDMVLHTLARFHAKLDEAIVVGDSSFDIGMALAANVRICAVSYGAQPAELLRAAGATWLIDTMPELLGLIGIPRPSAMGG